MQALLQVRDLDISYRPNGPNPHHAVRNVSFDVCPGEILGLMGESGCGKTSIAMSILGLLDRDLAQISGSIIYRDKDLLSTPEPILRRVRGAEISLVFQEPEIALCPVMRIGQQIAEVLRAHKNCPSREYRTESDRLLRLVGFLDPDCIASRYPHQLSGGQRQRVLLAQALACRPALVLLDEPATFLDARSQEDFFSLLRKIKEETGTAMMLISHMPEAQASLADRLLIMAEGKIIERGDVRELFLRAADPRTRRLLRRDPESCSVTIRELEEKKVQLV